ncbi:MAG: hypothetical protein AAF846_04595 [Chloroflexota bacterium]
MVPHYLALTIDTDPDGLNSPTVNRANLEWDGLHFAMEHFHNALADYPLTWYVRADGQLEHTYGSARYLLDTHADFWSQAIKRGDELGWHPHLYTIPDTGQPEIITDSQRAVASLKHIWQQIQDVPFDLKSFRMGEGWHTSETLNLIEALGFRIDSTAIPNRDDSASAHPRNWSGAPNRPYYPDLTIPRLEGEPRPLIEIPMTTWRFQASYDKAPKLRYMNPCIHEDLWQQALNRWEASLTSADSYVWVLILHPAEAMPHEQADLLYAYSLETTQANLQALENCITTRGDQFKRLTISQVETRLR